MTRTERAVHAGPAARGLAVMVGGRSQNRRSLQNMNKSQLARPCTGQENAWGVLYDTPAENARVHHTWNRHVMDPIPLNAVRATAIDVAADVSAAVDSAGDLYRRACRVRRHCGLHVPRSARRFWL